MKSFGSILKLHVCLLAPFSFASVDAEDKETTVRGTIQAVADSEYHVLTDSAGKTHQLMIEPAKLQGIEENQKVEIRGKPSAAKYIMVQRIHPLIEVQGLLQGGGVGVEGQPWLELVDEGSGKVWKVYFVPPVELSRYPKSLEFQKELAKYANTRVSAEGVATEIGPAGRKVTVLQVEGLPRMVQP